LRLRPLPRRAAGVSDRATGVGVLALPERSPRDFGLARGAGAMTGYIVRRILAAIPTLLATSIVVFLMVRLMPGDVIDFITGGSQTLTPEQRHQMEHQLGLDQSYVQQYWEWIRGLLTGDMGKSLVSTLPVGPT